MLQEDQDTLERIERMWNRLDCSDILLWKKQIISLFHYDPCTSFLILKNSPPLFWLRFPQISKPTTFYKKNTRRLQPRDRSQCDDKFYKNVIDCFAQLNNNITITQLYTTKDWVRWFAGLNQVRSMADLDVFKLLFYKFVAPLYYHTPCFANRIVNTDVPEENI